MMRRQVILRNLLIDFKFRKYLQRVHNKIIESIDKSYWWLECFGEVVKRIRWTNYNYLNDILLAISCFIILNSIFAPLNASEFSWARRIKYGMTSLMTPYGTYLYALKPLLPNENVILSDIPSN